MQVQSQGSFKPACIKPQLMAANLNKPAWGLASTSHMQLLSAHQPAAASGRNYTLGLAHAGDGRVMGCVALHTCGCA